MLLIGSASAKSIANLGVSNHLDFRSDALLLIIGELSLGVWLLSGLRKREANWVASGVFLLFTIVSASKYLTGSRGCGCFGNLEVAPLLMFGIDMAVLGALAMDRLLTYPPLSFHSVSQGRLHAFNTYLVIVSAVISVAALTTTLLDRLSLSGSAVTTLAVADGERFPIGHTTLPTG